MENEMTNPKDVPEPDAVVSGRAGTGQKLGNETENTLCVIPHAIARQIHGRGDKLFRMSAKRTHWYHYNVTVRTKSPKRELKERAEKFPAPVNESPNDPDNKQNDTMNGGVV